MLKILLLAVVLYFGNMNIPILKAQEPDADKNGNGSLAAEDSIRDPFVSIVDLEKIRYQGKGVSQDIPSIPMALKGLMVGKSGSVAIINDEIVTEGQIWHDFNVEKIDQHGITLNYKDKTLRLELEKKPDSGDGSDAGILGPESKEALSRTPIRK